MSLPAGNRTFAQRLIHKIEYIFSTHKPQLMGQKALKLTVVENQLFLGSLHLSDITTLSGEATEDCESAWLQPLMERKKIQV